MKKQADQNSNLAQEALSRNKSLLDQANFQKGSKSVRSKEFASKEQTNKFPFSAGQLQDQFSIEYEHCRGGYGTVYKGHFKEDQSKKVAIKAFFPSHRSYYALQEVLYMLLLEPFEGFTKLLGVYTHQSYVFLVLADDEGHELG